MGVTTAKPDSKRFVLKRSSLSTDKLFVEFYLPEYRALLDDLRRAAYPLKSVRELSKRMFAGPFGSDRKVDMYQESGIPYIRVKDVLEDRIERSDLTFISQEKHDALVRSRVVPGNILMTIAGRLGTAAVFPDDLPEGNITGHIVGIELKAGVNPHFVTVVMNSKFGQFQVKRLGHRTTRPELNLKEVGRILIPLPTRPIQDRIAQVMQDAYAARRAKLAEADKLSKRVETFVLGELGIDLATLQKRRSAIRSIKEIAGGRFDFEAVVATRDIDFGNREPTHLQDVAQHPNDRVLPSEDCPDEEVNYIGLGNIASNTGDLAEFAPVRGATVLSSSPRFQRGDILFGRMRPYLNKVWIAEFDGVCSGEAVVLRPDSDKVDTRFLHALLLSRITLAQVVPLQSGTSLPRVSAADILSIQLPVPSDLRFQERIGDEIAHLRTEAKRLRAEAETVVAEARARVERMILGEEDAA